MLCSFLPVFAPLFIIFSLFSTLLHTLLLTFHFSFIHVSPPFPPSPFMLSLLRQLHNHVLLCFADFSVFLKLESHAASYPNISAWQASTFSCLSQRQASTHHCVIAVDEKRTVTSVLQHSGTAQRLHQSRLHQPDRAVITQIAVTFKCKMKVN